MVRVAVSVEGITEERFIRRLLLPEWNERNIYASISRLNGNVQIRRIAREIEKLAYSFDYVTTLYDYYGFRKKPPDMTKSGLEESIKALVPPSVR
ncbi:MAG: DUF4276 family protein, partial [Methylobacteriaceae bacterium]|nr:DUF4276 family protein [Methylobacteriaceae bacterium]